MYDVLSSTLRLSPPLCMALGYFVVICCLLVNKIVNEEIKVLLHDLSWIPISMQSFISISYPGFEIHLSKLTTTINF